LFNGILANIRLKLGEKRGWNKGLAFFFSEKTEFGKAYNNY